MLILTEKSSVAKDFAISLNATQYEGYYQTKDNVIITYCVGHLYELAEPDFYNEKFKKWTLTDLPIIPQYFTYKKTQSVIKQTNIVLSLLKQTKENNDKLIIATDADREGELIARIVLSQAGITNISNCFRFWVSEALIPEVIKKGLDNLKPLSEYNNLSEQAFARQHADWLIGMNFTRFISIGNPSLFSVGRVQTAVLSAIAKRNYEVKNFIFVPYNELEAEITDDSNNKIKAYLINPINKKNSFELNSSYIQKALNACANKVVSNVQTSLTVKTIKPPKLLNINELQKLAYKLYNLAPEKTLSLAQVLYEKYKCLSYPRTSSRVMGDDNVDLFMSKYNLLKTLYPEIASFSVPALITKDNKHIFNSSDLEAHHALIPLCNIPNDSTDDEKNVYNIVIENFFTVCMDDYKYTEKKLLFFIDSYVFSSNIKEIIQNGFKFNHRRNVTASEDEEQIISNFNEKKTCITKLNILNKKTQPQKEFSIDTLLTFMEHPQSELTEKLSGLGTPATRADIIKKLFSTEYIQESKNKLFVTSKGMFLLAELAKDPGLAKIANVAQTTRWEQELTNNPAEFEKNIKLYIVSCIKPNLKETYKKKLVGLCPLCGNEILEGKSSFYCSAYNAQHKCNFILWKKCFGTNLFLEDVQLLLENQKTKVKKCKSKDGKNYNASFQLDEHGKISLTFLKKKQ